jgi:DNA-binding cell septation regulator SpoVG
MNLFMKNPFTQWQNLTVSPCVVIKRDILRLGELFHSVMPVVKTLNSEGYKLSTELSKALKLETEIKAFEKELKDAEKEGQHKILKKINHLKREKNSLVRKNKGLEEEFIEKAAASYVDFIEALNTLYRLNIQCLTLIHRSRNNIDDLIRRVQSVKPKDIRVENLKSESITNLNIAKSALKELCENLYRTSEFQSRRALNPEELAKEIDMQGIYRKVRICKRLTIEIDNIEDYIATISKNLIIVNLHHLIANHISRQIKDFRLLSHDIKILTHRMYSLMYAYPQNNSLKKQFRRVFRKIEKQTRKLMNSIHIKHYKPKQQNMLQFRKKPEPEESKLEEITKAA